MQDHMNSEKHSNPEQQEWVWRRDDHHSEMAARTTTDPATLAKMVEEVLSDKIPNDYSVSWALMANKNLPFESAAKLANAWGSEADLYLEILERDAATPEALDAWADSDNMIAVAIIAAHPHTKAETLVKLTKHPHPLAPYWVIITGRLPQDIVSGFASSKESRVREAVAAVSNNPETLKKLAADPATEVRLAVARNPHSEAAVIDQIARQEAGPSAQMGRVLGKRLVDPDLLATLAAHCDPGVRLAVARNPQTSAATVKELARSEQHPGPALSKVLGKRLDDPGLLQTVTSNAKRPLAEVIYKGANPARHIYTITMHPASRGRTQITISVKGTTLGERTTFFDRLFVAVCSGDQAYEIAWLQKDLPRLRAQATCYDQIQRRHSAALAELERRLGYSASYREKAIAERDKDIAEGKYAEKANSTRQEVAKVEAKLLRLKSGRLPEFDQPFIRSWHQRRHLVRRPEPGQKLLDIIEIKVP